MISASSTPQPALAGGATAVWGGGRGEKECSDEGSKIQVELIISSVLSGCHRNTLTPSFITALSLEISIISECHTDKMFN